MRWSGAAAGCVRVVDRCGVKGRRKRVIVVSSPSCDVHVPSIDSDPRWEREVHFLDTTRAPIYPPPPPVPFFVSFLYYYSIFYSHHHLFFVAFNSRLFSTTFPDFFYCGFIFSLSSWITRKCPHKTKSVFWLFEFLVFGFAIEATDPICDAIAFEMLDVKPYIGSEDHVGRPAPITNFPMLLTSGIFLSIDFIIPHVFSLLFFKYQMFLTSFSILIDWTESTYKSAWTSPTASQASGKFTISIDTVIMFVTCNNHPTKGSANVIRSKLRPSCRYLIHLPPHRQFGWSSPIYRVKL